MISKKSFIKIVDGLRDYMDSLYQLEKALDIYFENNFLAKVFDTVMNALCEDVETEINDEIGPLLYHYAFECDWGRNDKAIKELPLNGEDFPLTDAGRLYDYLTMKND